MYEMDFLKSTVFNHYPSWLIKKENAPVKPNTVIYIDEQNLINSAKTVGIIIDFKKLKDLLYDIFNVVAIYIFVPEITSEMAEKYTTWYLENGTDELRQIHPNKSYIDLLSIMHYRVITKPSKMIIDHVTNKPKLKRNIDVDMTTHVISTSTNIDHVIIFTGDGDFISLVKHLQSKGHIVTVAGVKPSDQSKKRISNELIRQADIFINLIDVEKYIHRDDM